MGKLKSLAGQTAIYGVSSILGRVLNYTLVWLHTSVFPNPQDMGTVTGLYSYVAIFLVIYTFGMETSFFRFVSKDNKQDTDSIYNLIGTVVLFVSIVLSLVVILNASQIAEITSYPQTTSFIRWLGVILLIDGITAIPFAKLRIENRAKKFAVTKMAGIITNVVLQLIFLWVFPSIANGRFLAFLQPITTSLYQPQLGIGYIFLANLVGNVVMVILLSKTLLQLKVTFDWNRFKPILLYGLPILITGIAGMFNEQLDKILLEKLLPDDFYPTMNSTGAVGVYGQTAKLSVFMMLAIQAFRYAGEPFFFANSVDKNAPALFAKIMHYFVIAGVVIFVGVSVNIELIAQVFLRNESYRVALYIVPVLLLGKLFWGIYVNLSIWFKLKDKTIYGTYFAIGGALVTIIVNVALIPVVGYAGSAIASVCCYLAMVVLCYFVGNRYFPVPYRILPIFLYIISSIILVYISFEVKFSNPIIDNIFNLAFVIFYIGIIYWIEKNKLTKKTT